MYCFFVLNKFLSRVWRFADDLQRAKLLSLANWFTSDQMSLFMISYVILYCVVCILSWNTRAHEKKHRSLISPLSRRITYFNLVLWCHAKAMQWDCDLIFADCHCTHKLGQRWYSLGPPLGIHCEYSAYEISIPRGWWIRQYLTEEVVFRLYCFLWVKPPTVKQLWGWMSVSGWILFNWHLLNRAQIEAHTAPTDFPPDSAGLCGVFGLFDSCMQKKNHLH